MLPTILIEPISIGFGTRDLSALLQKRNAARMNNIADKAWNNNFGGGLPRLGGADLGGGLEVSLSRLMRNGENPSTAKHTELIHSIVMRDPRVRCRLFVLAITW